MESKFKVKLISRFWHFFYYSTMCLPKHIEYLSSNITINFGEHNFEWPLDLTAETPILACNICLYPMTLAENILDEILSEDNKPLALILPINKLLSIHSILNENFQDQWKTTITCLNCGTIKTYTNYHLNLLSNTESAKILTYFNFGPQIAIFNIDLVRRDTYQNIRREYMTI